MRIAFITVIAVCLCLCNASCLSRSEDSRSAAYRFTAKRGFVFDTPNFQNVVNYSAFQSLIPICRIGENFAALCRVFPGSEYYVKTKDIAPVSSDGSAANWTLQYIEARDDKIHLYLLPPPLGTLADIAPTVLFERHRLDSHVLLHLLSTKPAVQMSHIFPGSTRIGSINWHSFGTHETLVGFETPKIIALDWNFKPLQAGAILLEISPRFSFSSQPLVVIDAGHGGNDLGACVEDICEKDINLTAAIAAKQELETLGIHALLTRDKDLAMGLQDRVLTAETRNAELLVSIHADNWRPGGLLTPRTGATCYYQQWISEPFAKGLCKDLRAMGYSTSGFTRRSLHVIHSLRFPSVLVELGNLNHPPDFKKLSDPTSLSQYGKDLATTIKGLLEQHGPE